MNERIDKLVEQCRIETYGINGELLEFGFDEWKFAELIVRECAGLFPNVYVEIETDYGHTPVIAADYIKNHFGIK
jgi:hypothetical protein